MPGRISAACRRIIRSVRVPGLRKNSAQKFGSLVEIAINLLTYVHAIHIHFVLQMFKGSASRS